EPQPYDSADERGHPGRRERRAVRRVRRPDLRGSRLYQHRDPWRRTSIRQRPVLDGRPCGRPRGRDDAELHRGVQGVWRNLGDGAATDLAVRRYTSGATGRPKGVMITHGNLLWMASALSDQYLAEQGDVGLLALPVSHLFGLIVLMAGQVLGTPGVLLRWFTP